MHIRTILLMTMALFLMGGCAYRGIPPGAIEPFPVTYQSLPKDPYLAHKLTVMTPAAWNDKMSKREVDNRNLTIAVANALKRAGFFADNKPMYRVEATLLEIEYPYSFTKFIAISKIRYRLIDNVSGKIGYDEVLTLSGSIGRFEAFGNNQVLSLITERAMRENITHFIKLLSIKNKPDLS